jgi:peptide subunit release factor RF-3
MMTERTCSGIVEKALVIIHSRVWRKMSSNQSYCLIVATTKTCTDQFIPSVIGVYQEYQKDTVQQPIIIHQNGKGKFHHEENTSAGIGEA